MRPILMMTLSACIGLLPAAISTGIGSQVQRPLATVDRRRHADRAGHVAGVVPAVQSLFLGRDAPARPAAEPGRVARRRISDRCRELTGAVSGCCLLAVVFCGASAPRTSVAEEAPAKSEHYPAAESRGGNADHAAGEGAGKPERNPANSTGQERGSERSQERGQEKSRNGAGIDRSDSRFAVDPHRPPTKPEDGRGPKAMLRSFTHGNVQTHRSLAARPSGPVVRNAIGVAVGPHEYRSPRRSRCSTRRSQCRRRSRRQRQCERRDRQSVRHSRDQQIRPSGPDARRRAAAPRDD